MKFHKNTRRPPIDYEKDIVSYWKDNKIFEKSVMLRPEKNAYVFYDGPPFITGVPHYGTLLSSVVKDAVPRYWTMKGKRVERRWGWDCHGLPAEVFTEQKLGIKDKRDIYKIGLEKYIIACRDNMVQTGDLWESTIDRIGRWVNFRGAYKTMDKNYMESIWWAFKQLYDAGKIYEGEKVLLYCTRDATPVSKAETAMDNSYEEDTDPSVYVKFKLADKNEYLLAWTTTPWTLHSNTALAINKNINYVEVEVGGEHLILAKKLLTKVLTDEQHKVLPHKVLRTFKGQNLVGKRYEPLFEARGENAHRIWHADFVHTQEGTGIAHESPAYGEEDYELSEKYNIPRFLDTDDEGFYTSGPWKGKLIWDVNNEIARYLHKKGIVRKIESIKHSYPHCYRCGTKLMYRAHPSWFLDINSQRKQMLVNNNDINWFPTYFKRGRFEKTIQTAPDWNISRDRFWATAMPIWKGMDSNGKEHIKVVGSYAELKELSGVELEDYHRPWVDNITFSIDGIKYKRIDKVIDCWFESGSMPFAQFHYPFENKEKFDKNFPSDFIAEYVGQIRTWFYYLHTVAIGLFDKRAFNKVIVTGTLAGNDGRKMSKSYGNYTDPNILMDKYSADALRLLLLSSPVLNGEDFSLLDKDVEDVARKLTMIWNMYDFFSLYADVDQWEWNEKIEDPYPDLENILDKWIVCRVHQLSETIDTHMQSYDVPSALKPVLDFIDDASNWYVRCSRKRFWKSQNDSDKNQAYRTLHYVLLQLSIILAPFIPFLSEELYRKLTNGESVHLLDWPEVGHINELILTKMSAVRKIINIGLRIRAEKGIKVRQPLSTLYLHLRYSNLSNDYLSIIKEELNVKTISFGLLGKIAKSIDKEETTEYTLPSVNDVQLATRLNSALKQEGIMRELIRYIQNTRKQAGLKVDDRINLRIITSDKLINAVINLFEESIKQETLAVKFSGEPINDYEVVVKLDNKEVTLQLTKAKIK